ncbi:conserved hypothetical protein [Formosa agariphila KMM 3901]|uniref:DUF4837 domain-containing protein n=1 Tax=Formosa agariphila (strain DSM 15362 / KCTC 12365 / LMG 23005 / KMM 3901 / M-2Alg 35-1) TaxID=1347342 RepID=T2KRW3_FORAG|nr:DUF4837 family protein [Formosa agariphila]CDF81236.1 conserved hypothetical protein [Formosa agariphila KMM 3901]
MHKILFFVTALLVLTSCNDDKKGNQKLLSESSGNLNNLSVVVDNELWQGNVGEAIRNTLASPVDGLPQDEPLFSLSQIPPQVFSGFVTKNRTVLRVEVDANKTSSVKFGKNVYAIPQKVIVVSGKTEAEVIEQLKNNAPKIIEAFKNQEIKEKQRRIKLSLLKIDTIEKALGIKMELPSAYRIAKKDNNFFWLRKDITTGTQNIMLYELPLNVLKQNDSLVQQIIKIRDSIGQVHIPGPTEGTFMITEKAYAPYLFHTTIDDKPVVETKGIWDVKNAFMSGPFINYIIEDKANNRLLVVEGFTFAPSVEKRDYVFELDAIMKSIKFE